MAEENRAEAPVTAQAAPVSAGDADRGGDFPSLLGPAVSAVDVPGEVPRRAGVAEPGGTVRAGDLIALAR
ncbi:hypothetical protein EIL87_23790 [Saccharopolyspora rhizosphaerae]|uniref:Uncharacterized protein n=1 Tax=Saccharopolyspora rhizosphaerae TaxID=2492662 RepID=A0A426JHQ3_9PSEU|nr:hypothetical protein [Saccharopolyspora rhizosphaerae]RRO12724.1 hypothetical protein EIL87_23790 [Saccharopolyspora rhizosphaerae]